MPEGTCNPEISPHIAQRPEDGDPAHENGTFVYLGLALVHTDLNTCCDTLRGRTRTTCVDALRAICCDPSGVIAPSLKG